MNNTLPLFPLKMVVFPSEEVNLHIFEPRYRQLINECATMKTTFGIPPFFDDRIMGMGTEMELVRVFKKYDDGKMDIRARGVRIFRILEFFQMMPERLYAGARVSFIENSFEGKKITKYLLRDLVSELFEELGIQKKLKSLQSFDIAHFLGMNIEEEYELLSLIKEEERQEYLIKHIEKILPVIRRTKKIKDRIQMNGHFQNLDPLEF